MMEEYFAKGNTLVHRRDPRVKVVVAFLFVLIVAISNSFMVGAAGLALAFPLILISRLDLVAVGKRLLAANTFTIFLLLTLPFTYGGQAAAHLGPLTLSHE